MGVKRECLGYLQIDAIVLTFIRQSKIAAFHALPTLWNFFRCNPLCSAFVR